IFSDSLTATCPHPARFLPIPQGENYREYNSASRASQTNRPHSSLYLSLGLLPKPMRSADEIGGELSGTSHALFDRRRLHPLALEMLLKSFKPLFEKLFKGRLRKWQLHAQPTLGHDDRTPLRSEASQVYDELQ